MNWKGSLSLHLPWWGTQTTKTLSQDILCQSRDSNVVSLTYKLEALIKQVRNVELDHVVEEVTTYKENGRPVRWWQKTAWRKLTWKTKKMLERGFRVLVLSCLSAKTRGGNMSNVSVTVRMYCAGCPKTKKATEFCLYIFICCSVTKLIRFENLSQNLSQVL